MNIELSTYYNLFLVSSPTVDTSILWNFTFLFIGLGVLYFGFIFFFKSKLSKIALKTASTRAELAPIISNFLFHSAQDSKDDQKEYINLKIEIREYLRNKTFRKILAEILFDLQKDVAGTTEERLFKLYRELGLHHDAFSKLKSWRWQVISQGILELTQMQVGESYQLITKFINDRRGPIRKQAEIATIKLRDEGIEFILDSTTYAISEWQQLKMIEALSGLKDYSPPRFKSWLISENTDVVLFALRLIKHYNQNDAAASIIELVKHKNNHIKLAAIQCIKDFNFKEAKSTLRAVFLDCTDEVKIQILSAVALFGDASDIPFLNGVSIKETNFLVCSKASGAINIISPDTVLPTKDIKNTKPSDLELEVDLEKVQPTIIHSDETTTVSLSEDYLEIETAEETDVYEVDDSPKHEKSIENIEIAETIVQDLKVERPNENKDILPEKEIIVQSQENDELNTGKLEEVFEFGSMDQETDASLNNELGLLSSKDDDLPNITSNSDELEEEYAMMTFEQKNTFIDTIESLTDVKQIGLLEEIMEKEDESELRFKAFKKLQLLKTNFPVVKILENEYSESNDTEEDVTVLEENVLESKGLEKDIELPSVFLPLYQKTWDLDSKLILIKEMESLGDEKEVFFLRTLIDSNELRISKSAKKAIVAIENRISDNSEYVDVIPVLKNEEVSMTSNNKESALIEPTTQLNDEASAIIEEQQTILNDDNKLPLELCFLYDEFGINAPKNEEEEESLFDFEISEEFFLNLDKKEENEH